MVPSTGSSHGTVTLARRAAEKFARRVGVNLRRHVDPNDFLGAAWEGAESAARRADRTRSEGEIAHLIHRRATGAIQDELRKDDFFGRGGRKAKVVVESIDRVCGGARDGGAPIYRRDLLASGRRELEKAEARMELEDLARTLKPRDRYVLLETTVGGRLLKEVADTLGLSESRVAQIRAKALRSLGLVLPGHAIRKRR